MTDDTTHPYAWIDLCLDCGFDTRPGEPGSKGVARQCEWYSVWDYLWQEAGMPSENEQLWSSGFLCIGCLEKRLGRELTAEDFPDCPINHQHDLTHPGLLQGRSNIRRRLSSRRLSQNIQ